MNRKFDRKNKRQLKRRLAVIGEGPTEWHFVDSMIKTETIPVTIKPSLPKSSHYKDIFSKASNLVESGFDKVFCLIDMDVCCEGDESLRKYSEAKRKIKRKLGSKIEIFETMPCIEYWFLLYFKGFSSKIYHNCDDVVSELKKFVPDYSKSNDYLKKKKIYSFLIERGDLEKAKKTAERLSKEKENSQNRQFPYTDIGKFIEILLKEK
jgi:hypothetical protein